MNQPAIEPVNKPSHSGFLLLSMVLAVIFIIVVLMPLEPSDYWTYLRIGNEIIRTNSIPTSEFMTYTSGGQPAVFSYWLASLVLFGIYKAGGLMLTALVMGIFIVGMYALNWLCLRELKLGPVSASLVLLITALMGSNNWSIRPQVFALPFFGLSLLILLRWQNSKNRMIWLLPIITIFWVNLHGSFILLFVLLFSALLFGSGNRKYLLIVSLISLAATLVNPYGFQLWTNTAGMIGSDLIKTYSAEWQPPMNQGWQLNLFFGSLLVIALAAAYSKVKVNFLYWVWFLGFGWMAVSSIRYVLWFSIIAALLLSQLAEPWLKQYLDKHQVFPKRVFNITLGVILLFFSLAFLPGIRQNWWSQAPSSLSDTTPVQAVEWIKSHPDLPEHIWANWVASIYMSYTLPERPVWVTNRIEDFEEQIFLDNKKLLRASFDWQEILEGYDVNLLMLDRVEEKQLITAVSSSTNWIEIYRDERELIYIKADHN
ncbi:MAG: hypothetical protein CVU42_04725 [Chloroflexi bacterium HGW-Chloroflexi-4]|jgi:hypothetical protein|nr:MAG: hypothetical protein CVU42_04725 [Chloroflexi bacterium HGW-Chloroflexi-4]